MKNKLKEVLTENDYRVTIEGNSIVIEKRNPALSIVLFILMIIVVPFAVLLGGYKVMLLAILLISAPFIYTKWRLPRRIVVSTSDKNVIVRKSSIPFHHIEIIVVVEDVRTSHVSPFEEGYQDFIYKFILRTFDHEEIELFELKYRKPMNNLMNELVKYLNVLVSKVTRNGL